MKLLNRQPILSEDSGEYTTEWYCEPPPGATPFHVLKEEWACPEGTAVRKIYEVKLAQPIRYRVAADLCLTPDLPMWCT